jgi:hypothetical protein
MSANQVVLYFGCQFGYVGRRARPPKRRSGQGCGRDLQSQSNHS